MPVKQQDKVLVVQQDSIWIDPNLKLSVDLEADIASNTFGGTGIQHTGSCGESTTMLHYMKVEWE